MARTPRSRNSDSVHILEEVIEAVLGERHAPDTEVAEVVLVAEVDDVGQVPDAASRAARARR